jgi:hypothetical protein
MVVKKDVVVDRIKADVAKKIKEREEFIRATKESVRVQHAQAADLEDEEDIAADEQKAAKSKNFEFSDNLSVFRLLKTALFLQIIAIIIDHPRTRTPPIFNMLCSPWLFYTIRFYSRPFVDAVYLLQQFLNKIIEMAQRLNRESDQQPEFDTSLRRSLINYVGSDTNR